MRFVFFLIVINLINFVGCVPIPFPYQSSEGSKEIISGKRALNGKPKSEIMQQFGWPSQQIKTSYKTILIYTADKYSAIGLWFYPWAGGGELGGKNQHYRYLLVFNAEDILEDAYYREWEADEAESQQLTKELIASVLKKLSDIGDAKAALILKRDYGNEPMTKLPEFTSNLIKRLKLAADKGDAESMYQIHLNTSGPEKLHWLCGASDLGHAEAMYRIGDTFWFGNDELSIDIDLQKAHKWYALASLRGHYWANKAALRTGGRLNQEELAFTQKAIENWQQGECQKDFGLVNIK